MHNYNNLELRSLYALRASCIAAALPKTSLDIRFENEKLYNTYDCLSNEVSSVHIRIFKLFFLFGLKKKKIIFIDSKGKYNKLLNVLN